MDTTRMYDIVNGPNRDGVFDLCKYACKNVRLGIEFTVAYAYTGEPSDPASCYIKLPVSDFKICGLEYEDGSGDSFNLHGHCQTKDGPYRFKAYYNSRVRKGTITFLEQ